MTVERNTLKQPNSTLEPDECSCASCVGIDSTMLDFSLPKASEDSGVEYLNDELIFWAISLLVIVILLSL